MADAMNQFNIKQAQPAIWELLDKIIIANRIGSAYLFSGPSGAGKEAAAIEFGAEINKKHFQNDPTVADASYQRFISLQHELLKLVVALPAGKKGKDSANVLDSLDNKNLEALNEAIKLKGPNPFHKIVIPSATRIRIDSIRELRRTLYLKSSDIGRKFVLIFDAHLLSEGQAEAANALLKILEEPPPNTTLILVTDNKNKLLPTILSRCQHIDFPALKKNIIKIYLENISTNSPDADFFAGLAQGDMHRAIAIAKKPINELIKTIQSLAQTVTTEKGKSWRNIINNNAQLVRQNPAEFKYHIYLLQLWFKSVYRLRIGVDDELHRSELLEYMQKFNQMYPKANLKTIGIKLEIVLEAIGRNLYMSLILTNLLIDIQKLLNKE